MAAPSQNAIGMSQRSKEGSASESLSKQEENPEANPTPVNTSSAPPDGGLRAWSVVFGGFSALVCTFGYLNSFGYVVNIPLHLGPIIRSVRRVSDSGGKASSNLTIRAISSQQGPPVQSPGLVPCKSSFSFWEASSPDHSQTAMASGLFLFHRQLVLFSPL